MPPATDPARHRPRPRTEPSILHVDLDAFFAAVEQRDKPSLRGKPVIVGGVGSRGVVATASYEARRFGVRSAMSTAEARARCPHAAFLSGRFEAYAAASRAVMGVLRSVTPLVEPLSLDEAFFDLAAVAHQPQTPGRWVDGPITAESVAEIAVRLKATIAEVTGGLTASVGAGTSKLIAKIASDLDKPDGTVIVTPGTERDFLAPMQVTVIPGVGPATAQRLSLVGVHTVADLQALSQAELIRVLGTAHGSGLFRLAVGDDDRPVVSDRETKSISVEDTFETDIADPVRLRVTVDAMARRVVERLHKANLSGRTVTLKVRHYDFTTHTRSATLPGPTDDLHTITALAQRLLTQTDIGGGLRLVGVGVSGLADWVQNDLFSYDRPHPEPAAPGPEPAEPVAGAAGNRTGWRPGQDVEHSEYGRGWVWGSGRDRVTVRFETAHTPPGPVRTFAINDPALQPAMTGFNEPETAETDQNPELRGER